MIFLNFKTVNYDATLKYSISDENIIIQQGVQNFFFCRNFNFKNKFLVHICSRKIISFASYCMGNEVKISLNFPQERERAQFFELGTIFCISGIRLLRERA